MPQKGPHFADPDSFEHQYGQRWKQMHELYKEKAEAVKRELAVEEQKLEAQMEFARFEHDTEQIRKRTLKTRLHWEHSIWHNTVRNNAAWHNAVITA